MDELIPPAAGGIALAFTVLMARMVQNLVSSFLADKRNVVLEYRGIAERAEARVAVAEAETEALRVRFEETRDRLAEAVERHRLQAETDMRDMRHQRDKVREEAATWRALCEEATRRAEAAEAQIVAIRANISATVRAHPEILQLLSAEEIRRIGSGGASDAA